MLQVFQIETGLKILLHVALYVLGVQHGVVEILRVQHCQHGKAQFPVQERHEADHVFGEKSCREQRRLDTDRHEYLLLRELLQKWQQDTRVLHDRFICNPIPVRQRHMLYSICIPVHVLYIVGNYCTYFSFFVIVNSMCY